MLRSHRLALSALLVGTAAAACAPRPIVLDAVDAGVDSGGGSGATLTGTWTHTDGVLARAYVFAATSTARPELAGESPTFLFHSYAEGSAAALVQAGTYEVAGARLITAPLWDAYGGLTVGNRYEATIVAHEPDRLVLRTSDGELEYRPADALP